MNERLRFAHVPWPQTADALGFEARGGDGVHARNGFALRPEGAWLALVERTPLEGDAPSLQPGAPGLWRVVRDGATCMRAHDLPLLSGVEELCEAGGAPSLAALELVVAWAAATRSGERDPSWSPPPRDAVEGWLAPARLHVRSGALLARGELVYEAGRLALVYPELARVPARLSPARRAWLDQLLLDAQRRWRLARFGVDADTRCVVAEVDLSGVPAAWARPLVQLSLEALDRAVEWVLAPLSFLVDPSATSVALERPSLLSLHRSSST